MAASETRNARVLAGGDTWAIDLNDHSHGFTSGDTLNETNEPASSRRWVQRLLTEYSRTVSVPVVFYGDATDALSPRTSGYSFVVLGELGGVQAWLGGEATWISVPTVAPQSGIVSGGVEFMQRSSWSSGNIAVPFNFTAGNTSVNISRAFSNTSTAYLVVTSKTVTGNRVITLSDGSASIAESFATVGVRSVDLSTLANNVASGSLTVASLTGDQAITGYLLIGTQYTIPSGVLS